MGTRRILLKPFTFSRPPFEGAKLPTETKFTPDRDGQGRFIPTEIELPDDVANHPWIQKSNADGCLESEEQTEARIKAEQTAQAKLSAENALALANANAAMARARGAQEKVVEVNEAALQKELNTPVSQLQSAQGVDIGAGPTVGDGPTVGEGPTQAQDPAPAKRGGKKG